LSKSKFRNVSIITSLNTQKNQINNLGSVHFAIDLKPQLTHFFQLIKGEMLPQTTRHQINKKNPATTYPYGYTKCSLEIQFTVK